MTFKKEIEQHLTQIYILEDTFRKVQDLDTLPLSFFSASIDALNKLKTGVYELESAQLQLMAKHLKESEEKLIDVEEVIYAKPTESFNTVVEELPAEPEKPVKTPVIPEKPVAPSFPDAHSGFLGDVIAKKIYADFSKSLNINQRFMLQKDLFKGNTEEMNKALVQLNSFHSLETALDYLNKNYTIQWESESGITFKDLMDKHFV
jgi:hypothetical protein